MATGLGKTIAAAMLMNITQVKSSVLLAHRDTLIKQAIDKLMFATGLTCGVEKAEQTAYDSSDLVVVGSVQSFTPERLARYNEDRFDLIIIDEAHLSASVLIYASSNISQGLSLLALLPQHLHDSRSLGDVYDSVAYEYNLRSAIKDGWLCPIIFKLCPRCRFKRLKMYGGDYTDKALDSIVPLLSNIAKSMPMIHNYKKSLCFCH